MMSPKHIWADGKSKLHSRVLASLTYLLYKQMCYNANTDFFLDSLHIGRRKALFDELPKNQARAGLGGNCKVLLSRTERGDG